MDTRTPRATAHRIHAEGEGRLGRTIAIFGVALFATVGLGLLLAGGHDDERATVRSSPSSAPVATVAASRATRAAAPTVPLVTVEATPLEDLPPVAWDDAEGAYFARDWNRAAELFTRWSEEHPGNAWGFFMRGLAQRQAGDLASAEAAFRGALAIDPDHGKSLVNLGRTLLAADRADEAREVAAQAVALDASSVDGWRTLGRALHSLGRPDEALDAYARALEIDPGDAWSLNNAGLILIEAERFADARERLERAVLADDGPAVFFNNLGVARERTGDLAGAADAWAMAVARDPSSERALASLARVESLVPAAGPATEPAEEVAPPVAEAVVASADPIETAPGGPPAP